MNLILFEHRECMVSLPRSDHRALHLLEILRRREGDTFDAGVINGPVGKGTLRSISPESVDLAFEWRADPPAADPLKLIVGLPRPQTARAILREAASLGLASLHFVTTEKGDPNYRTSSLWHSGEWRRHLIAGAEQAFCTRLPELTYGRSLSDVVSPEVLEESTRVALDNYESPQPLSLLKFHNPPVTLAIGAERGWSAAERDLLRERHFAFAHLGARVLRTETACIAAVAIVKAKLGWM